MNYYNPTSPLRSRAGLGLATVGAVLLIAGCGGSGNSSTITIGNENKADNALVTATATPIPKTPTTGPLSKEPTVTPATGKPPKLIQKKDLIVGTGPEATAGSKVTVNYVGVLFKGGKKFDASWNRKEPFTFVLGKKQVIPGWEFGIQGMKVGGRRELIIPSVVAYGSKGTAGIPPNETLIFVVDLLGV